MKCILIFAISCLMFGVGHICITNIQLREELRITRANLYTLKQFQHKRRPIIEIYKHNSNK